MGFLPLCGRGTGTSQARIRRVHRQARHICTPCNKTLSQQKPCSHSLPHLSSPWLNSSWPPARTSEKHQSWMWFWHSCQKACYGYKTRWELCWKKFYSQLIELKSVGRKYSHPMHPFIYFVTLIVKQHTSCHCCRGSKTLVSVRLRNCGNRMFFYSTYMKQATPLYGRLMCQSFPDPQQAPWQHRDNLTDAQGWCYFLVNSATFWLYRNYMGHKLLIRGEILQFHIVSLPSL